MPLGQQHLRAYRRLRYALRELRLTCPEPVSAAAERLSDDVLGVGHVLHVLGSQGDALECMDELNDDADVLVDVLREQHGLPALERD